MTAGRSITSQSQHWGTPKHYVEAVKRVFGGSIALDPCSNEHSVVGALTEYLLPNIDGLRESWEFHTIYVNPPYGADRVRGTRINDWLKRCAETRDRYEAEVLALVPVATNTMHWKRYVWGCATAVCFLYDTRLKFLVNGRTGGKGAPMSCAMVYWGDSFAKFLEEFQKFGAVVDLRPLQTAIVSPARSQEQTSLFDEIEQARIRAVDRGRSRRRATAA